MEARITTIFRRGLRNHKLKPDLPPMTAPRTIPTTFTYPDWLTMVRKRYGNPKEVSKVMPDLIVEGPMGKPLLSDNLPRVTSLFINYSTYPAFGEKGKILICSEIEFNVVRFGLKEVTDKLKPKLPDGWSLREKDGLYFLMNGKPLAVLDKTGKHKHMLRIRVIVPLEELEERLPTLRQLNKLVSHLYYTVGPEAPSR